MNDCFFTLFNCFTILLYSACFLNRFGFKWLLLQFFIEFNKASVNGCFLR